MAGNPINLSAPVSSWKQFPLKEQRALSFPPPTCFSLSLPEWPCRDFHPHYLLSTKLLTMTTAPPAPCPSRQLQPSLSHLSHRLGKEVHRCPKTCSHCTGCLAHNQALLLLSGLLTVGEDKCPRNKHNCVGDLLTCSRGTQGQASSSRPTLGTAAGKRRAT